MAYILKRKSKKGTSYVVRFSFNDGRKGIVCLDSSYSLRDAENARGAIEGVLRSQKLQEPLDRNTRVFLETAPVDLVRRFEKLGVSIIRDSLTVSEVWKRFMDAQDGLVKESSSMHRITVFKRFKAFFPDTVKFSDLTAVELQKFRDTLTKLYAPTTVSKSVADLRAFANWAVKNGYASNNPFMLIARGSTTNRTRDFQIPSEWTERILSACPSQTWRTLYCLWRHAGLRQQEPMVLRPSSVDLENKRLFVHATKTERYKNGGDREVPISPILARELERQLEEVPSGESYLIFENRRKSFDSGFKRILFDAGLDKWGKTFQNMRSSCENDWVLQGIPAHVVASWMGHSVKVQEAHYLRVLPQYYQQVTG